MKINPTEKDAPETLDKVPAGNRIRVRHLRGGRDYISRLAALGFTEGAEVQVIQNYGHGPLIALVRRCRVALGRGEALKVLVEEVKDDQDTGQQSSS